MKNIDYKYKKMIQIIHFIEIVWSAKVKRTKILFKMGFISWIYTEIEGWILLISATKHLLYGKQLYFLHLFINNYIATQ